MVHHSGTEQTRIYPRVAAPVIMGMEVKKLGELPYTINKGEMVQQLPLILKHKIQTQYLYKAQPIRCLATEHV